MTHVVIVKNPVIGSPLHAILHGSYIDQSDCNTPLSHVTNLFVHFFLYLMIRRF